MSAPGLAVDHDAAGYPMPCRCCDRLASWRFVNDDGIQADRRFYCEACFAAIMDAATTAFESACRMLGGAA